MLGKFKNIILDLSLKIYTTGEKCRLSYLRSPFLSYLLHGVTGKEYKTLLIEKILSVFGVRDGLNNPPEIFGVENTWKVAP